jgi:hypothetical protein
MEETEDGEMVPKRGKKYEKYETEWHMHSDHDSCWRDAVDRIIFEHRSTLSTFSGPDWHKVIPVPAELEELYTKEKKKRGYSV